MAAIISIQDGEFIGNGKNYEGFLITTDKFTLLVGIETYQQCCENFGHLSSLDNFDEFVGAELIKWEVVDEQLNTYELPKLYEAELMFVNIHTNKGMFQFTAYNDHNGYYSHEAVVIKDEVVEHKDYL